MILRHISRNPTLNFTPRFAFGIGQAILHWIRTSLNRVRWEENQQFHAIERRGSTVPKSAEEAKQLFIATQKGVALTEKERMQRIDQILGTKTYFHEGKVFQQRLDSDHLMTIDQLRRENPQKTREELDWENPQADVKIRYKHKKNYYQLLSRLRVYPTHAPATYDLADNTSNDTISFLAAETAYSTVSLKPVELAMESLQQESLLLVQEKPFSSLRYCYFRPQHTLVLLRMPKELYKADVVSNQAVFKELADSIESVISLQEVYEALKEYDYDERVAFYLRKIENDRLDYLFSDFSLDKEENLLALTIDLMGDSKEYCVLLKSLSNPEKCKPRPIFNLRPPVVFSGDSSQIFFIQRSAEGGWIELASRRVESCWKTEGTELMQQDEGIAYRCSADKQMKLGKIWNHDYIFVTVANYGQQYSQSLFLLAPGEEGLKLLQLDEGNGCKYFYDLWESGVIIGKRRRVTDKLKYGQAQSLIQKIQLIPFKQHIITTNSIGLADLQLPGKTIKTTPKPQDLDIGNKKTIFVPDPYQFISQVQARSTHLVIVLNFESVYDRACLYFLPSNPQAHPHSIIIKGDPKVGLEELGTSYNSQVVRFSHLQGLMSCQKEYNIWKRELSEEEDSSRYHREFITIQSNGYPFQLQLLVKKLYLSEKDLPVVLVFEGRSERINQDAMRQLLEKGVMLVRFAGRGTQTKDLEHYLAGSRHNFPRLMDDLQAAIQFVGNDISKNISLYCKGEVSSLVGLWFNFYFPSLFNASVLHNGLYDLSDEVALEPFRDFFGDSPPRDAKKQGEDGVRSDVRNEWKGVDLRKFNVLQYKFRDISGRQAELSSSKTLGYIQNVIISSDSRQRVQSRRLIKRLRENHSFKFNEVYLKEYENAYEADLFNLSYLYSNIRQRLERDITTPQEEEPASEEKQEEKEKEEGNESGSVKEKVREN